MMGEDTAGAWTGEVPRPCCLQLVYLLYHQLRPIQFLVNPDAFFFLFGSLLLLDGEQVHIFVQGIDGAALLLHAHQEEDALLAHVRIGGVCRGLFGFVQQGDDAARAAGETTRLSFGDGALCEAIDGQRLSLPARCVGHGCFRRSAGFHGTHHVVFAECARQAVDF